MTDLSNTEAEMTFEERNHLYHIVGTVWLVALFSFLIPMLFYFNPPEPFPHGIWNFCIWYGIPLSIIMPISWWLPYEVFYPKRVRKSSMFHTKRFMRRTFSMIPVAISFFGVVSVLEVTFYNALGDNAIFPGICLFLLVFGIAVSLWLRRQNSRMQL